LDFNIQNDLISDLREIVKVAPLFSPHVPGGNKMSVKMTSAGKYGWFSDSKGYRYVSRQKNGNNWPQIPNSIMEIWQKFVSLERNPDCCLINYYSKDAKMGMHQDNDEADFDWPVLSISLGDDALFRIGNVEKGGKTDSLWLNSGDIIVMGDEARLKYHGIDRIRSGTSNLLKNGGRINLTLRVVD
jgi:alkylated DNA repair protein (DNA oxidative demethylase)